MNCDRQYCGDCHWDVLAGFVLRNVFSESVRRLPDRTLFQRVFVLTWIWSVFVVAHSYAGMFF